MSISVCIATYRRVDRLGSLLDDLSRQNLLPSEIWCGCRQRCRGQCTEYSRTIPRAIQHFSDPLRHSARKKYRVDTQSHSRPRQADWLAFIDDDEHAPERWLSQLAAAMQRYSADCVIGPVVPVVPDGAPNWIRRGRFYDFPRLSTGEVVPLNRMRFGNILLRGKPLRQEPVPFDPAYGLSTGEDADLLIRLAQRGPR